MAFAQRSADHREILAEHEYFAAVDEPVAGDHTVAGKTGIPIADVGAADLEHVEFLERALVQEQIDALAGDEFAAPVLGLDTLFTAAQSGLLAHSG